MKFLRNLKEKDIAGKTAVLRLDLNVEPDELVCFSSGCHNWKIDSIKPTIDWLLKNKVKSVVILSHRGRPTSGDFKKFSLDFLLPVLEKLIRQEIVFWPNFDFAKLKKTMAAKPGIYLLENLRFLPGEKNNDRQLASQLAGLGDFYVNDAFAVSHRADASIVAITEFLPSYAGLLLEKEIENLKSVLNDKQKRLVVILGGAKVSDKIGLIGNFYDKAGHFLIGGAIANTFLAAKGLPVGESLIDEKGIDFAKKYIDEKKIILPIDLKISGKQILDIGSETLKYYASFLRQAETVIWNGSMGYVEKNDFRQGTAGLWKIIASLKKTRVIVGGGDTIASKPKNIKSGPNLFISTGGGAMLDYLSGKKLPGIEALD
ncbi:MAG: phosphoglycerate kinase [bacterium]|nr:phosphoglycerate kinase [bacterium]